MTSLTNERQSVGLVFGEPRIRGYLLQLPFTRLPFSHDCNRTPTDYSRDANLDSVALQITKCECAQDRQVVPPRMGIEMGHAPTVAREIGCGFESV
jgi:hypothetical protein